MYRVGVWQCKTVDTEGNTVWSDNGVESTDESLEVTPRKEETDSVE
jgi:hypothetical protein